jgi:hypothetical protein
MSERAPNVPILYIVATTVLCLILMGTHWRFMTGWQMVNGRIGPGKSTRDVYIQLCYAALPSAIGTGCFAVVLTLARIAGDSRSPAFRYPVFLFAGAGLACIVWSLKELYRPSPSRTPEWLKAQSGPR